MDTFKPDDTDVLVGVAVISPGGTQALWSCASDKIADAEKLLAK